MAITLPALRNSQGAETVVRSRAKKHSGQAVSPIELLNLLWDAEDFISGSGSYTDTFIGPNKILRKGVWDVGTDEVEGVEYEAVITIKGLVPAKKSAATVA